MAERTSISWTGATWNPWQGCRKKSRGCKFCYMFREKRRYGQDPLNVHRSSAATFDAPLRWQREVERGDRQGAGRLVFTCSWSDWFIREADAWRDDAWAIIRACPDLIFQVLTKRSERIADHLPTDWGQGYPNVWLGVSVENQDWADVRIRDLVRVPAAVRFLSCEPLLGPIDLSRWMSGLDVSRDEEGNDLGSASGGSDLDWVIGGGESGDEPGVEPTHPDWARSLRDQCVEAGVAFHWKQWGEWANDSQTPCVVGGPQARKPWWLEDDPDGEFFELGRDCFAVNPGIALHRYGKKAAGRLLDGREWNEFPRDLKATTTEATPS